MSNRLICSSIGSVRSNFVTLAFQDLYHLICSVPMLKDFLFNSSKLIKETDPRVLALWLSWVTKMWDVEWISIISRHLIKLRKLMFSLLLNKIKTATNWRNQYSLLRSIGISTKIPASLMLSLDKQMCCLNPETQLKSKRSKFLMFCWNKDRCDTIRKGHYLTTSPVDGTGPQKSSLLRRITTMQ